MQSGKRQIGQLQKGLAAFQAGRHAQAERTLRKLLEREPDNAEALHVLGLLAAGKGRHAQAERLLRRCVAVAPGHVDAHNNLGNVLMALSRNAEAEACYVQSARLAPRYARPRYNLGRCLHAQGKLDAAQTAYRSALALAPADVGARVNLANLLREAGADDQAEAIYRDLLEQHPHLHEARLNLGNLYRQRGDLAQAKAEYQTLLQAMPEHPRARLSLAMVCCTQFELDAARALIDAVRREGKAPVYELLAAQAALHWREGDGATALRAVSDALAAGADRPEYYLVAADLLAQFDHRAQAVDLLRQSLARFGPRPPSLFGDLVNNQRHLCDWRKLAEYTRVVTNLVHGGKASAVRPFVAQALPDLTAADLQAVARAEAALIQRRAGAGALCRVRRGGPRERLRIGYLSADYREHPTARLTVDVFEQHDRERFTVHGYALGPPDRSPLRQRVEAAFDHFVDLHGLDNAAAAQRIADDGIDILVDLQGYTAHARPEIGAQRPAPLQIGWLVYPATLGARFNDYMIADQVSVPPELAPHYDETLAWLPHCYLPIPAPTVLEPTPSRAEVGLPETGFVFCGFNNAYKLTPEVFDTWCRLLAEVPESVLWLQVQGPARSNLQREAAQRGVAPGRLVFADRRPHAAHMARLALADLFLDTWPYNGHTTASDALRMGVPVLTLAGTTQPARVAASLLTSAGLPELICTDARAYWQTARHLATDAKALPDLRRRLITARDGGAVAQFDSRRFTRVLEKVYADLWHGEAATAHIGT